MDKFRLTKEELGTMYDSEDVQEIQQGADKRILEQLANHFNDKFDQIFGEKK